MKLILASGSPRRAELLTKMGLTFQIQPSNTEEILEPGLTPEQEVISLSRQKAQAVYQSLREEAVVLSADTVVVLEGKILGKPRDPEDARAMLRSLSGKTHQVLTGVTLMSPNGLECHCEKTEVTFRSLTGKEIDAYVATGDPLDKAGAYGIQGMAMLFVSGIRGDYYNVVGLPVTKTALMLRQAGIPVLGETL